MNEQALADYFEDATWLCEHPIADMNFVGCYALSDLVREKGFRVIMNGQRTPEGFSLLGWHMLIHSSGQGSDEIFAGYPMLLPDFLVEPDTAFPLPNLPHKTVDEQATRTSAEMLKLVAASNPASLVTQRLFHKTVTPRVISHFYPPLPIQPGLFASHTAAQQPEALLAYTTAIPAAIFGNIASKWHPLHSSLYTFTKSLLENMLLCNLGDRGEMGHSVEGRTPFLDHYLTEYVNGMPVNMKIRAVTRDPKNDGDGASHEDGNEKGKGNGDAAAEPQFIEKYVLREAVRPFVTDEIYTRRKHPYTAPAKYPPNGPLHRLMKRLITEEKVSRVGFLDWTCTGFRQGKASSRTLGDLVDVAFATGGEDTTMGSTFRMLLCVAQWVVLTERFGIGSDV